MTSQRGGVVAPPCNHIGLEPVRVGPYRVKAAGRMYLRRAAHLRGVEVLVALNGWVPPTAERDGIRVIDLEMQDFGGVPEDWRQRLVNDVVPSLVEGHTVMAYCTGGHGRTGTLLASLIALLESVDETPDPIAAVRERHCRKAVETKAQAEGIFALRGEAVPERYRDSFRF